MISGVLLDLAGVVYEGDRAVPAAGDAIKRLRASGLPLRFLTNTTRTTKRALHERLSRLNLPVDENEIFTPARAARDWLTNNACTPHLLVHPGLKADFDDLPTADKTAVVVGDAADAFTYEAMNAAFRELDAGAPFLALAMNRFFKDADGNLSLDAGPFVIALEFACAREAIVLGKPSKEFFSLAMSSMNSKADEVVMVGDDVESDVSGALRAGLGKAILVRTGKYRDGDEARFTPPPTYVAADIGEAADWIIAQRVGT